MKFGEAIKVKHMNFSLSWFKISTHLEIYVNVCVFVCVYTYVHICHACVQKEIEQNVNYGNVWIISLRMIVLFSFFYSCV